MKYKDLDLRAIMEAENLDFAHWTYQRGQCSCCYGPEDQPRRYWRNGNRPEVMYGYLGMNVRTRKPVYCVTMVWKGEKYKYDAKRSCSKTQITGAEQFAGMMRSDMTTLSTISTTWIRYSASVTFFSSSLEKNTRLSALMT